MNQTKITIRTKSGSTIERKAEIVDKIDNCGCMYSVAIHAGRLYTVIDRDYGGPIYGIS